MCVCVCACVRVCARVRVCMRARACAVAVVARRGGEISRTLQRGNAEMLLSALGR